MTQAIDALVAEHADLERQLSDPELHSNPANARKVGRRFAQLAPIVSTHRKLMSARGDLETARQLAVDDASFADRAGDRETPARGVKPTLTHAGAPSWTPSSPTCWRHVTRMTPTMLCSRSNPARAAKNRPSSPRTWPGCTSATRNGTAGM